MPFWTGNQDQNVYTPNNVPTPNPTVFKESRLKYNNGVLQGVSDEGGNVVISPSVSVLAFGAVGDGTTDDYAALQAAINHAQDNGLYLNFESDKTYKVSSSLTFKHGQSSTDSRKYHVRIRGNGATIYPVGGAVAIHIQPRCTYADRATGRGEADVDIRDVTVDGFFGASTAKALILGENGKWCSNFGWSEFYNITVSGFTADHTVVEFIEARHFVCSGLAVRAGTVSIAANTAGSFCGDALFEACEFSGSPTYPPLNITSNAAGSQVRGISFSACDFYGAGTILSSSGAAAQVGDIWFDNGCQFDYPSAPVGHVAVSLSATGSGTIFQIYFLGAYFAGFSAAAIYGVSSSTATIYQLTIANCGLGAITGHADTQNAALYFNSVESLSIRGCEFDTIDADQLINIIGCTNVMIHDNKATRCTASNYLVTIGSSANNYSIINNLANVATAVVNDYTTGSPTRQTANNLAI